jgi:hypothetical protein
MALKFEMSTEEMFWQEKILRQIESCESIKELKEIATLLAKVATQRQVAIKALVKDALDEMEKGLLK